MVHPSRVIPAWRKRWSWAGGHEAQDAPAAGAALDRAVDDGEGAQRRQGGRGEVAGFDDKDDEDRAAQRPGKGSGGHGKRHRR